MGTQNLPWRLYLHTTLETFIAFYLATFSLAMFFTHRDGVWGVSSIILIMLYFFVIGFCIKHLADKLPLQALMIIIPIAPFIALSVVLTLIPILEFF